MNCNNPCPVSSICNKIEELDKDNTINWLSAILFARNVIAKFKSLSNAQKKLAQTIILKSMSLPGSSDEHFDQAVGTIEELVINNEQYNHVKSELALYKSHSSSLAESLVSFLHETMHSEDEKERLVSSFSGEFFHALESEGKFVEYAPKLKELVSGMLAHYKKEAEVWEAKAKHLETMVNVDPLLDPLHNRRALDAHLDKEIGRFKNEDVPLSLIMIDIDNFKSSVNDVYGHPAGDDVLKAISRIIHHIAERNNLFAARYGGDEIVVVCNTSGEEALAFGDMIRYAVQEHTFRSQNGSKSTSGRIKVTISVGIAEYHGDWSGDDLLRAADAAMYHVKDNGKNNVSSFCVVNEDGVRQIPL